MAMIPFAPIILYPLVSKDRPVQARYEQMRQAGESHAVAEMLALGRGPALLTDAVFLEGMNCNASQFETAPEIGDFYRREAEAQGVSTTGRYYCSGLARFPGDPEAWIDGRGDVRRICERRGWGCEGAVSVPVRHVAESGGDYRVADDLVAGRADDLQEADPGLAREEAEWRARQQLSPAWDRAGK